jgi:hypothetical protein
MLSLLAIAFALLQEGPVPPQRIDPQSVPTPPAVEPLLPRGLEPVQEGQPEGEPGRPSRDRAAPGPARSPTPRRYEAASIFTDEAYRRSRVRWLLERAFEGLV